MSISSSIIIFEIESKQLAEIINNKYLCFDGINANRIRTIGDNVFGKLDLENEWEPSSKVPGGKNVEKWILECLDIDANQIDRLISFDNSIKSYTIHNFKVGNNFLDNYYYFEKNDGKSLLSNGFTSEMWDDLWNKKNYIKAKEIFEKYGKNMDHYRSGNHIVGELFLDCYEEPFFAELLDTFGDRKPEREKIVTKPGDNIKEINDFFKENSTDPKTIDFSGKTICITSLARLSKDDRRNDYDKAGNAMDVAAKVIDHEGGKLAKTLSAKTDYAVVLASNKWWGKVASEAIFIEKQQKTITDIFKANDSRAKSNKTQIGLITEDVFYEWLKNYYDTNFTDAEKAGAGYGVIKISVSPKDCYPASYYIQFKSNGFITLTYGLIFNAVNNNESFASTIAELEKVTGANSFSNASQTQYNKLLELDEKYMFDDYKNLVIECSTTDNKSFKVTRNSKVQDSIQTIPWTVGTMDNYGRDKVNKISQLLKLGHNVKIRMRIRRENDKSEWEEKMGEFEKIKAAISGIGAIQEDPTLERNGRAVYMLITSR